MRYTCCDCRPVLQLITSDVKGICRQAADFADDEQRYPNMQEVRVGTKVPSTPRQPPNRSSNRHLRRQWAVTRHVSSRPVHQQTEGARPRCQVLGSSAALKADWWNNISASTYLTNLGSHLTATVGPRPRIRVNQWLLVRPNRPQFFIYGTPGAGNPWLGIG
jgi:hypothetical protein